MARKNLIGIFEPQSPDNAAPAVTTPAAPPPAASSRPLAGMAPAVRSGVPVGGITRTLGSITQKMERAQDLERQLAEGLAVVELDPSLIDSSFVSDRMLIDGEALSQLVGQVREHGQQVPILVRPHPEQPGRFQVAYGHRRLAAVKQLGFKVKAVVRVLTDDQLVVSQGQENNARTNLSHMERALFATRLEDRSFTRDIIMAALGVDKAALSKMISLVRAMPSELIDAIGPAPEVGRRRWMDLADKLATGNSEDLLTFLQKCEAEGKTSDERFQLAYAKLTAKPEDSKKRDEERLSDLPVIMRKSGNRSTFVFDAKSAPGFDDFVSERLTGLFAEFNRIKGV